jgi:hypothetical protein
MNVQALEAAVESLKNTLRDGLIAVDIWDSKIGMSLAGFNGQPVAVALFTKLTEDLMSTIATSGFPQLSRYYLLDLEGGHTVVVIKHAGDIMQGLMIDTKRANIGILLSVCIPDMLTRVKAALA